MGYTRGSQILAMKNLKKYFWSVWINVTTGIIKKGYSSTQSSWNPIYDNSRQNSPVEVRSNLQMPCGFMKYSMGS